MASKAGAAPSARRQRGVTGGGGRAYRRDTPRRPSPRRGPRSLRGPLQEEAMATLPCGDDDDPAPPRPGPAGVLYVPVRPGPRGWAVRLFRTPPGGRTAVGFTTGRRLTAALGAHQPWIRLAGPALRTLTEPLGIATVTVDPRFTAPAATFPPPAGGTAPRTTPVLPAPQSPPAHAASRTPQPPPALPAPQSPPAHPAHPAPQSPPALPPLQTHPAPQSSPVLPAHPAHPAPQSPPALPALQTHPAVQVPQVPQACPAPSPRPLRPALAPVLPTG
ncbi:SAV_915 family protein [Streptomyces lavendofoliae]|uniref:SAV_915 family protein n=1 Tax=Streptomyces lavendofoliae TaxID=67314 RepID=UPI003D90E841